MKKAKDILNLTNIAWTVIGVAIILVLVAVILAFSRGGDGGTVFSSDDEHRSVVVVSSGDTLSKLLTDQGFTNAQALGIAKILKDDADVTNLRADRDRIEFVRTDADAPISKIVIVPSPWRQIQVSPTADGGWSCETIEITPDTRAVYRAGEILDGDSFYLAGARVRSGQHFSVLYEENFANGKKVENGNVLAVSFEALRGNVKMYRFKKSDGKIGYYDENGNGAIKSLKRTPINNAKVTSSFSNRRKHPVLGYTRAHKGVDFRASTGTPIPAAGAGRVVARGYNSGHGNYIKLRHNASFETLYAHMSRFAKGVVVGTTVKQGQTIGYVGSTGLSTGPHLHYEIIKDGKHVNPMTVKLPAINNLGKADKEKFIEYRKTLDTSMDFLSKHPDAFIQL